MSADGAKALRSTRSLTICDHRRQGQLGLPLRDSTVAASSAETRTGNPLKRQTSSGWGVIGVAMRMERRADVLQKMVPA
jgi:hypothetical protein